jgi:hypothetical protein
VSSGGPYMRLAGLISLMGRPSISTAAGEGRGLQYACMGMAALHLTSRAANVSQRARTRDGVCARNAKSATLLLAIWAGESESCDDHASWRVRPWREWVAYVIAPQTLHPFTFATFKSLWADLSTLADVLLSRSHRIPVLSLYSTLWSEHGRARIRGEVDAIDWSIHATISHAKC